ncbi:hypothetical protein JFT91_14385 [Pseudomonas sp. TH08]|uniref:hypothetical protein n=1 Tax=unclassified Pseudomonas TaxID=196821 RepID=UPI00191312F5|nr:MULTISPECIES: hypothetical protein [unclassified Pseudomonas]MBK5529028.1 hypothetical protein [Pseudomonas sp. TH06]MBK5533767.1 hypothetical protein [Pseudomonas sp. TH08]
MIDLVACIKNKVVHADGSVFESFYDWQGHRTDFEVEMAQVKYRRVSEAVELRTYIVSDKGSEIIFSAAGIPCILPDRTGVLVVFDEESSELDSPYAPWFFVYPHNAAIYNTDGTLRFQLHNPHGKGSYIGAIHSGAMPEHPNTLGVLIGTVGHDPEWLYLVDPETPKLIPTGKWIRY